MKSEIDLLKQALDAAPDHWETRRHLAEHHFAEGNWAEAGRLIDDAPAIPDAEDDQICAARLLAGSNPDRAHSLLDSTLDRNPASAPAHLAKAEVYHIQNNSEAADKHGRLADILGSAASQDDENNSPVATLVTAADVDEQAGNTSSAVDEGAPGDEPAPAVPRRLTPPPDAVARRSARGEPPPPAPPLPDAAVPRLEDRGSLSMAPAPTLVAVHEVVPHGPDDLDAIHLLEMEREEAEIKHRMEVKNKISSAMISIGVHLVVFFVLGLVIIATPRQNPPELVAVAAPSVEPTQDPKKKQIEPVQAVRKPKPSAKVVNLVTATNYSSFAIPPVDEPPPDLLVPGLSVDDGVGFNISFEGISDGWIASLPVDMQSRCSLVERMSRLKVGGGNRKCEDAVNRALAWLAENQSADGSWGKGYPVAMTGLALLSFLGHCETPDSPQFAETVVNAATYLMNNAIEKNGHMYSVGGKPAYEHGIGTYALCELYTLSRRGKRKIPGLSDLLKDSLRILIQGQNPNGSWNYAYKKGRSDTSVAGWQMQALSAARHTEIEFTGLDEAFEKGVQYMISMQGPKGGFGYSDDRREDKISLTGVGVLALQFGGHGAGAQAQKGLDYILETRKSLSYSNINVYEWYYSTQACFQDGGDVWDKWNEMFLEPLLDAQDRSGYWPGRSNDPTDEQTKGDGNLYRTCLATLMLEVYYRYLPTTEKIKK